jgi:hypothetical protein
LPFVATNLANVAESGTSVTGMARRWKDERGLRGALVHYTAPHHRAKLPTLNGCSGSRREQVEGEQAINEQWSSMTGTGEKSAGVEAKEWSEAGEGEFEGRQGMAGTSAAERRCRGAEVE